MWMVVNIWVFLRTICYVVNATQDGDIKSVFCGTKGVKIHNITNLIEIEGALI